MPDGKTRRLRVRDIASQRHGDAVEGAVSEPTLAPDVTVDVSRALRSGGAWSIVTYAFSKLAGFASSIVLCRLLMPEHFGLVGMSNTLLALVQIVGSGGLGWALVHQRKDVEEYAQVFWWLDIAWGFALFALANLLAPLAAQYYHEPKLPLIVLVTSFNFLINPLGGAMFSLMYRDMQFGLISRISIAGAFLVSVTQIAFAFAGFGVWSFIYPHIISGIVTVFLRWRYYPSFRPRFRRIQWYRSRKLLSFGWMMTASAVFDYVNNNADFILVGGLIGKAQLGLYVFAYNLGMWAVQNVASVVSGLLFPAFSSVQDQSERAREMFLKFIRVVSLIAFPIVALQWATAPLYVGAIYGQKWMEAVLAFKLIALYGVGRAVCAPALTIVSAMGRPDINLKLTAFSSPILVGAIYLGVQHGINGVAAATAIAHGLLVWLYVIIPFRVLGWSTEGLFGAFAPALICSLAAGVVTAAIGGTVADSSGSIVSLLALLALGGVCYVVAVWVFFRDAGKQILRMVRAAVGEMRG